VSITSLRRWVDEGRVHSFRTAGGHRRYPVSEILRLKGELDASGTSVRRGERVTIAYARVSSHDQKDDLARQITRLVDFCTARGWQHEVIEDLGSGLNYNKRGLRQLIRRICSGEVARLVLTHKDRLLRFGAELVFSLCEQFGTEVVLINAKGDSTYEEDLAQDVLEIITVFSARLYGARSHKNKKALEALREAADAL
jgi:predicted site-specific integrase-resolvase